jgi:prepilin-type N-terminal cleavage/methylation domain-containing protein
MNPAFSKLPVRNTRRHGFTLLEMCIVLFIIALLASLAMPAMNSAFTERGLRNDSHEFSLMVKTAMIKSGEEQRPYIISLQGTQLLLEPAQAVGEVSGKDAPVDPAPDEAGTTQALTLDNALKFPDMEKKDKWDVLPAVTWTFQPNALCPLPRVRFERGKAYIELSFNALTGNVEDEAYYLP